MRILVTGGTGSFGSAFVRRYHKEHQITVFSRDETKQFDLRLELPEVQYRIGDVRDRERVFQVMKDIDCVFHAAALKQVPSCEFFPLEAVKTNILGASNVLDAAQEAGAKVICLSTDKAVYPINAMGMSKALMEKVAISKGGIITRYGNVLMSRGSIVPLWQKAAAMGAPLSITNPDMTRFLLTLEDSIDLVMFALEHGDSGDVFVKKAPACTMNDLADAIGGTKQIIGIRHGEKMHEALISQEEMLRAHEMFGYYRVRPDVRDMNYSQFYFEGSNETPPEAYTSENTTRLTTQEVKELLSALETIRN